MLINQWQKSLSNYQYKGIIHFSVVTFVWALGKLFLINITLDDLLIWILAINEPTVYNQYHLMLKTMYTVFKIKMNTMESGKRHERETSC